MLMNFNDVCWVNIGLYGYIHTTQGGYFYAKAVSTHLLAGGIMFLGCLYLRLFANRQQRDQRPWVHQAVVVMGTLLVCRASLCEITGNRRLAFIPCSSHHVLGGHILTSGPIIRTE